MLKPIGLMLVATNPDNMVWIAVFLGFLLIGGVLAFLWIRRWFHKDGSAQRDSDGFTLEELRQMLRDKKITQQEFDALKQQLIERTR